VGRVSKDYHPFLNDVKFLKAEAPEEGGGEGEPDTILSTPTLALPRQKGEGNVGEKFNTGFPLPAYYLRGHVARE
jgi:hypothetical protein